jgi:hypothetical protein
LRFAAGFGAGADDDFDAGFAFCADAGFDADFAAGVDAFLGAGFAAGFGVALDPVFDTARALRFGGPASSAARYALRHQSNSAPASSSTSAGVS